MKTNTLTDQALDWAVSQIEGHERAYSTDWAHGGPIIEMERIELEWSGSEWWARIKADDDFSGPTPLVAAMRCFVASRLGDEVDIPEELK
jgi:hypothetical protein